jgi:glycosyltransferase involved in cell wall biosynthesis
MEKTSKVILISCDSPRSLLDFRGKLIELLASRHQVNIFTPTITQPAIRRRLTEMGVDVYENSLEPSTVHIYADLLYLRDLFLILQKLRPDVFFPYTFKPVIYGALVARFCGIKRITPMLTGLGYNFSGNDAKITLLQRITRALLKLSLLSHENLHVIFQNQDDCLKLQQQGIIGPGNKVHIVNGSGVDLSHYAYSEPDLAQPTFLMMARLIKAKGIQEYYEAAKMVKDKFPAVRFRLIGAYEKNVDAIESDLYAHLVNDGVIEYLGLVDDVRTYISGSSVVVLPSYYGEGVPRCLLEAMAMGRPIITCDSVGCRETVNQLRRHANGFLIPVKDAATLADKMIYYLRHPSEITRFGLNGRKYAADKFDVHKVNSEMMSILT